MTTNLIKRLQLLIELADNIEKASRVETSSIKRTLQEAVAMIEGSDSKGGKWTDKDVFSIKETTIEEMQSAKCSKCGKIHTTPYMYYFFKYDFCPCCGERMEE